MGSEMCIRDRAGTLTHQESTYVVEIALYTALISRFDIILDGSLQDWRWHAQLIRWIRYEFPLYKVAIIHVIAHRCAVWGDMCAWAGVGRWKGN